MNNEIKLDTKWVGDIAGKFFIPSYQRGYRWGKAEVKRLLDDIYTNGDQGTYYLQPIVVRRNEDKDEYELIDGQQRLTTIYLIYHYMNKASQGVIEKSQFTLAYETREKSADFLANIDSIGESQHENNIDFWFMWNAYKNIKTWFAANGETSTGIKFTDMNKYLGENVKVIWYEVDATEDSISLFTRLNIGKIPLTNAELVKALFLTGDKKAGKPVSQEKQLEIALQWDIMEKELHDNSFWYFLTNSRDEYQTRIDLVLNLMALKPNVNPNEKRDEQRDKYATFFFFAAESKKKCKDELFNAIWQTYLTLKSWYEDHELYHKIGYLIVSGAKKLQDIFNDSKDKTKSKFKESLYEYIQKSIEIKGNYSDLSYENSDDKAKMARLLLLFNIESVRLHDEQSQRFPFNKYKWDKHGKTIWSLEHIHARHSDGLRTKEMWKEWLKLHRESMDAIAEVPEDLREEVDRAILNDGLTKEQFDELRIQVEPYFNRGTDEDYLHSISNMALLNMEHNAALNNSAFDVKRNRIIEMDKAGDYIPFCTRRVFLKYYTPSEKNQLHFWGIDDRYFYVEAINKVLESYRCEKINFEKTEA